MKRKLLVIIFLLPLFLFTTCRKEKEKKEVEQNVAKKDSIKTREEFLKKSKKIFHAIPTPVEAAIMLRNAGATYNPDLLNSYKKVQSYQSTKEMAVNLGIYSVDLSYASLFDQTQLSMKYMASSKQIAEELGIVEVFNEKMINKLKKNINNKSVVMDIVAKAYRNSNTALKKSNRHAIAIAVLAGGWLEATYISTQLTDKTYKNTELVKRILEQRIPLNSLLKLMKLYKSNTIVAEIYPKFKAMNALFKQMGFSPQEDATIDTNSSGVSVIKSNTETDIDTEIYRKLCEKIESLRQDYVS